MKKIATALLALTLLTGIVAPSFAWDVDNCPFNTKSLCETQRSGLDTTTEE